MAKARIGLIGLAVMGANLARNLASKNIETVVYNRTTEKTDEFIINYGNSNLKGTKTLEQFVDSLESPRKIILMVKAGEAVDKIIEELLPWLGKDDLIIDCGNSHYEDTIRRHKYLQNKEINFVGCGVSGGEEGALKGPSLMPGGNMQSWQILKDIWESIAAKDFMDGPCVTFLEGHGAGHFVKMVHNGIEYAEMQIIAEAYDLLRKKFKLRAAVIAEIFVNYNKGKLNSYLLAIAARVLEKKDDLTDDNLVDMILDKAAQKGTGLWTATDALRREVSLPTITEAVIARTLSGEKKLREKLAAAYPKNMEIIEDKNFINILENALYASTLICYAQGYDLIMRAADKENWKINLAEVSRIWEGGCIIRAKILAELDDAYRHSAPENLLLISSIIKKMNSSVPDLRKTLCLAIESGIAVPCLSSSLSYFDSMTNRESPANLIQGLRDYFGAHTYERNDRPGSFHTEFNE